MELELEKKIILRNMPPGLDKPEFITQAYLYTEPFELRIRKQGYKCQLTYKSTGDEERREWENEIPCWLYDELETKHVGRVIMKKRYTLHRDGLRFEIDEYLDDLKGLIVAEVEFQNRENFDTFKTPAWLGRAVDVTLDSRYKNKNLATNLEPNMKPQ